MPSLFFLFFSFSFVLVLSPSLSLFRKMKRNKTKQKKPVRRPDPGLRRGTEVVGCRPGEGEGAEAVGNAREGGSPGEFFIFLFLLLLLFCTSLLFLFCLWIELGGGDQIRKMATKKR